MHPSFGPQVGLPWLARLRWIALTGQLVAVAAARAAFDEQPRWAPVLGALAAGAASNLWLARRLRDRPADPEAARVMGGVLALDVLLLTALLATSGGPTNPLSILYLVYVALAAVVLGPSWTAALALGAVAGFAALFALPVETADHAHHAHGGRFASHLYEMWLAFTLAAALVAYFLRKIAATIAEQREQIARLREGAARSARLAAITTLAAGAAHELGSPLGTISVAAREVELAAARLPGADAIREDMRLILAEVERCDAILGKLSAPADPAGDLRGARVDELEGPLRARLGAARARHVSVAVAGAAAGLRVPREHLLQSLAALVQNALDASAEGAPVAVRFDADGASLRVDVEDRGAGMPAEVLAHAGDPFFTTKEPGRGLGLGLFLARACAESLGGSLSLESRAGEGTRATLTLPRAGLEAACPT
ncbi:MAG TPA: HAMP domain-containing sensor histidine kinase [Polyangiaceae bacterium]|nr:HAMP domain-containing sensor histidine kinase [Polyangiaceae bacterium]